MTSQIKSHISKCSTCAVLKQRTGPRYGLLPLKNTQQNLKPWKKVYVDSIGSWTVMDNTGTERVLKALAIIDLATGWFEVVRLRRYDDRNFGDFRYDLVFQVPLTGDSSVGTEFNSDFTELMDSYGVKITKSTRKNPQSNAVTERIHLVILNMQRTFGMQDFIWDGGPKIWERCLSKISWAIRSTFNTITKYSPCQMVFNRDMILHTESLLNWDSIRANRYHTAVKTI